MKILLLDDEKSLLSAIERVLVQMDHMVDTADDAEKAVEMVKHGDYDFAIVDYMMPGHDGVWFMKNAHLPHKTKVLLMTAFVDRDVITTMFKLGACGYLIKPVDVEELCFHLNFHTGHQQALPL